jgi:putative DNA primase/helicase
MSEKNERMLGTDQNAANISTAHASEVIEQLAKLTPIDYEKTRSQKATELGIRSSVLDKEVKAKRALSKPSGSLQFDEVEPWHEPVQGDVLLSAIRTALGTHIVCADTTAVAASLWIAFTWFIDAAQVAPLAVITAPDKRCGKSQLLDVIGRLVRKPLVASNISPAATFRVIESCCPTLLIDEADSFFKDNEELRGVINSGHTRSSAYVIRTVGDDHEPKQFSTWGAKAISGIGTLADTLMDRAIVLEMRRKLAGEKVIRLRHSERGLFDRLKRQLAKFAEDHSETFANLRPDLPEELNDRAQDNWEPLLAIADMAGGDWPRLAKNAALTISKSEQSPASVGTELLQDIYDIFQAKRLDRIGTSNLIESLCENEELSWATYNRGRQLSPKQLANKLKAYGISSKNLKSGFQVLKGFDREQFEEAFARYLFTSTPENSRYPLPNASIACNDGLSEVAASPSVSATESFSLIPATNEISSGNNEKCSSTATRYLPATEKARGYNKVAGSGKNGIEGARVEVIL